MPGIFDDEPPEEVVVATISPQEVTHILEQWKDYKYVEVARAHSEEEARAKAQKIANKKDVVIRIRLKNSWDD